MFYFAFFRAGAVEGLLLSISGGGAEGSITWGGSGVSITGAVGGDFFVLGSSADGVFFPGNSFGFFMALRILSILK
jgi:hypothetical protein